MKLSRVTDGASGQLGKHRAHFSVTSPRQLSKHAGLSVIDASINKPTSLICVFLMYLHSIQISMVLNLYAVSQRSSSDGFTPSYAFYHHPSHHHLIS